MQLRIAAILLVLIVLVAGTLELRWIEEFKGTDAAPQAKTERSEAPHGPREPAVPRPCSTEMRMQLCSFNPSDCPLPGSRCTREWIEKWQRQNSKLTMPCTWISKTGALEPLRPQCVNADFSER